jgi:hypothetical protein
VTKQSDALRDRMGRFVDGKAAALATATLEILRETTPVDTGAARDGWEIVPGPVVVNDEEHIRYLNEGSSQQAPAGFVESALAQAVAIVRAMRGRAGRLAGRVSIRAPGVDVPGGRRR